MMRLLLGQTGAPTSVVNRSIAGFLRAAQGHEVLLAHGGPEGLVSGNFSAMPSGGMPDRDVARAGSWLGSGRKAIDGEHVEAIVSELENAHVEGLCLIGGNGTMALLDAIGTCAKGRHYDLRVTGIPKTIDNDLAGVDHAPGYPSAARFLALMLPDYVRDHIAMASIERVRIIETMGRSTGWLALAASTPAESDKSSRVDRVYIPEVDFSLDAMLSDVAALVARNGRATIVVSEGVAPDLTGQPILDRNHSNLLTGGIARILAQEVRSSLGLTARGEVLGVVQRCAAECVSEVDAHEAISTGALAAEILADVDTTDRIMVGVSRQQLDEYRAEYLPIPFSTVAGMSRQVPPEWRSNDPAELESFYRWLRPLISLPPP